MSSVPSTSAINPLVATHPSTPWAAANPPSAAKPATTAPRFKVGGSHDQGKVQTCLSKIWGPISITEFDAHDAQALCHLPPLTITSPNVGWVPRPFLFEDKPVFTMIDGRDFEPIHNSSLKIGFLKKEKITGLHGLFNKVRKHLSRFKGEHLEKAKNDQSTKLA
ncbi:hypothetical protein BDN67DRAFT_1016546 [Paxillus ammoniavirescens]|nr:hypothetical protein BDN67DRAFT_1016546 [Paxillus ammoniavirescens]